MEYEFCGPFTQGKFIHLKSLSNYDGTIFTNRTGFVAESSFSFQSDMLIDESAVKNRENRSNFHTSASMRVEFDDCILSLSFEGKISGSNAGILSPLLTRKFKWIAGNSKLGFYAVEDDEKLSVYHWNPNVNPVPRFQHGFVGLKIVKIHTGCDFAVGLTSEGVCYSWKNASEFPEIVANLPLIKSIACGFGHIAALTADPSPKLFTWGMNTHGQLGRDSELSSSDSREEVHLGFLSSKPTKVHCGDFFTIIELEDGSIWLTGRFPVAKEFLKNPITCLSSYPRRQLSEDPPFHTLGFLEFASASDAVFVSSRSILLRKKIKVEEIQPTSLSQSMGGLLTGKISAEPTQGEVVAVIEPASGALGIEIPVKVINGMNFKIKVPGNCFCAGQASLKIGVRTTNEDAQSNRTIWMDPIQIEVLPEIRVISMAPAAINFGKKQNFLLATDSTSLEISQSQIVVQVQISGEAKPTEANEASLFFEPEQYTFVFPGFVSSSNEIAVNLPSFSDLLPTGGKFQPSIVSLQVSLDGGSVFSSSFETDFYELKSDVDAVIEPKLLGPISQLLVDVSDAAHDSPVIPFSISLPCKCTSLGKTLPLVKFQDHILKTPIEMATEGNKLRFNFNLAPEILASISSFGLNPIFVSLNNGSEWVFTGNLAIFESFNCTTLSEPTIASGTKVALLIASSPEVGLTLETLKDQKVTFKVSWTEQPAPPAKGKGAAAAAAAAAEVAPIPHEFLFALSEWFKDEINGRLAINFEIPADLNVSDQTCKIEGDFLGMKFIVAESILINPPIKSTNKKK
jgi:Regulator of chromosome condensation (RCC1) repeat